MFFSVMAAVVLTFLIISQGSQPLFRADAEVLLNGPSIEAEMARLRSPAMASVVAARLHISDRAALMPRDGVARRLRSLLGQSPQSPSPPAAIAAIVECLQENVSVTHMPETLSLTISYSAADAAVAARVVNAYAAAYTDGSFHPGRGRAASERIIASAAKPLTSISLGLASAVLVGLGLGSFLGLAAALVTELRFPGLTTGADVQNRLWIRHLGSVPTLASALPKARSVLDAVVDHPQSGFAEAFRNVIRRAQGAGTEKVQVIAVASSRPGEGATTVALAMARTLALGRRTVVLVDCDVRRRISRMFGVDAAAVGLADVLNDGAKIDEALFDDAVSGAAVLPETRRSEYRSNLLVESRLLPVIDQLRARYETVLLSVGPASADMDVRWLQGITDTVLLITRWRSTPDTEVDDVIKRLRTYDTDVRGVVLNQVDIKRQMRYTDDEASVYQQQFSKYFSESRDSCDSGRA